MTIREALKGKFVLLILSKNIVFDFMIQVFIWGISNTTVRADIIRGLVAIQKLLRGVYIIAEESKKLKEELPLMNKLKQEQNKLDFLYWVVKDQVTSKSIFKLIKSYTHQTAL